MWKTVCAHVSVSAVLIFESVIWIDWIDEKKKEKKSFAGVVVKEIAIFHCPRENASMGDMDAAVQVVVQQQREIKTPLDYHLNVNGSYHTFLIHWKLLPR